MQMFPTALWCSVVHIDEFPAPALHGKYADHTLRWVGLSSDLNAKATGRLEEGPAQTPQCELIVDGVYCGVTLNGIRGFGGTAGKITGQHKRKRARCHCEFDHLARGKGHKRALDGAEQSAI